MSSRKTVGEYVAAALNWVGSAAGLGLLWVAFSLPLVTIFASTAGLLSVLGRWAEGDQPATIATFRAGFRTHVRQAVVIQLLWMLVLALAWSYLQFAAATPDATIRVVVLAITLLLLLVAGGTAVFVLPVLVDHPGTIRQVLRNSALLAAANPGHAMCAMVLVVATVLGCLLVVPLAPVTGVVGTYLGYRICRRAIRRTTERARRTVTAGEDAPAS